jgi:hypothetical protein
MRKLTSALPGNHWSAMAARRAGAVSLGRGGMAGDPPQQRLHQLGLGRLVHQQLRAGQRRIWCICTLEELRAADRLQPRYQSVAAALVAEQTAD